MGIMNRDKKPPSPSSTSPCAALRATYYNCFNRWYSEKFVKGRLEKEDCVAEWAEYKACLSKHLKEKHLRGFLEAEALDSFIQSDTGKPVDASANGVSR